MRILHRWVVVRVLCATAYLLAGMSTHAQTTATDLPEVPPANRVLDTAKVLDDETAKKLGEYLVKRFEKDGTLIYFASFETLPEGIYPAQRAQKLSKLWFGNSPTAETFGAVLVYAADAEKFGVALTPAASRDGGVGIGRRVVSGAQERISSYSSSAEALSESVFDLEYSIRQLRDEKRQSQSLRMPILVTVVGLVALAGAFGIHLTLRALKMQNVFGRAYVVPHSTTTERLGGSHTGGHSAVVSWDKE